MEKAFNRMLRVLKQCEGGIESGVRTHENRGIIYSSEFGHTFLMHIKETIYMAEQAQQAEPRCACGDSFTSDAVCANCLAAQQQAEPVSQQALEALKAHHAAAMGAGLDMSHALSQLRVQAYKESQLYRDTVAAIDRAAQKGGQ